MTIRIPKAVAIGFAALAAVAVGVGATLVVTGGGDDEGSPPSAALSTDSTDASSTESESQGEFDSADLEALDAADTEMQESAEAFQASVYSKCSAAAAANQLSEVADCFERQYAPYGAAIEGLRFQFKESLDKASGDCGNRLAEAQAALVSSQAASEALRDAFVSQNFGAGSVGAFGKKFSAYRRAMDAALAACVEAVPGYEIAN